jgi:hypothetical protein
MKIEVHTLERQRQKRERERETQVGGVHSRAQLNLLHYSLAHPSSGPAPALRGGPADALGREV